MFMITSQEWLNPTRAIGLVAYGTAVTCCGIAWIRTKARRASQLAAVLMLIESALLLDMAFNWRWKLHQALMDFAMRKHEYAQRGLPQLIVVTLLGALLLFGWFVAWRSFRGRGTTFTRGIGSLAVAGRVVYRGGVSSCRGPRFILFGRWDDGSNSSVVTVMHHDFDRNLARPAVNPNACRLVLKIA